MKNKITKIQDKANKDFLNENKLEKKDIFALIISALIVFLPLVLILTLIVVALILL